MSSELPSSVPVADTGTGTTLLATEPGRDGEVPSTNRLLQSIMGGGAALTVLSIVMALVAGGILMAATNTQVQQSAGYFFGRPSDTLVAIWNAVSSGYIALFQGGVYNFQAPDFATGIQSILGTPGQAGGALGYATPLIAAGLGIAVGFRTGIFNIGGQGQILIGAALGGWIGFAWTLPFGLHMIASVLGAMVGAGVWALIAGILKARTGAHEVVVTIMLNLIAFNLVDYLLHTPVLRAPGSQNPQSPGEKATAQFFGIAGPDYALDFGFVLAIAATVFCWWLLTRSSLGFKLRAVGENPRAAKVAGINVDRMVIYVMIISGALVGVGAAYQVLGNPSSVTGWGSSVDAGLGFQAITVALLGRSRPWGVFAAGILFGVLQAGSYDIQSQAGIDQNIVPVIQSVIVLFLAAPPLIRAIFHLPTPGAPKRKKARKNVKNETAKVAIAE